MQDDILSLLEELINIPSVTPHDEGCQKIIADYLKNLGFSITHYDNEPVNNVWATYGNEKPLFVFAGHTDVVATGPESEWQTPPFKATLKDGVVYGRGAADMKGALAAMLVASKKWVNDASHQGSLGFLITSGEEGELFDLGTPYVMKQLEKKGEKIDHCLVGEPSSTKTVGDVIKIGRRGSLSADISIFGKQGHIAYPHLAKNPIHLATKALAELTSYTWDQGNRYFPPTSFQISDMHAGTGHGNVIPGELNLKCNFRYSTEVDAQTLKNKVENILEKHQLQTKINWRLNGEPFLTEKGKLIEASQKAIKEITRRTAALSTAGGTSDGRFIAPYGVEVIELGPVNATIHQVNECVHLGELTQLTQIYYQIIKNCLH